LCDIIDLKVESLVTVLLIPNDFSALEDCYYFVSFITAC